MVDLTTRDWKLLRDLYDKTVISFGQIKLWHFAGKDKSTCQNRLSKLVNADLVQKHAIGRVMFHGELLNPGVVYALTKKGLGLLQMKSANETLRSEPVPLNTSTLIHDLKLNELMERLKEMFIGVEVIHGKLLGEKFSRERLPDLVMKHHLSQKLVAIELELTSKSETRYRHIVVQYQVSSEFMSVLYITNQKSIRDKIVRIISHREVEGFISSTGKFYFTGPDLRDISNGQNVFNPNHSEEYSHAFKN